MSWEHLEQTCGSKRTAPAEGSETPQPTLADYDGELTDLEDLLMEGDVGLAKMLAVVRGAELKNIAGDKKKHTSRTCCIAARFPLEAFCVKL